jgi:hypothetical protein
VSTGAVPSGPCTDSRKSNRFGCCAARKTFPNPEPTERKPEKKLLMKKTENALAALDIPHSSAAYSAAFVAVTGIIAATP